MVLLSNQNDENSFGSWHFDKYKLSSSLIESSFLVETGIDGTGGEDDRRHKLLNCSIMAGVERFRFDGDNDDCGMGIGTCVAVGEVPSVLIRLAI